MELTTLAVLTPPAIRTLPSESRTMAWPARPVPIELGTSVHAVLLEAINFRRIAVASAAGQTARHQDVASFQKNGGMIRPGHIHRRQGREDTGRRVYTSAVAWGTPLPSVPPVIRIRPSIIWTAAAPERAWVNCPAEDQVFDNLVWLSTWGTNKPKASTLKNATDLTRDFIPYSFNGRGVKKLCWGPRGV